MIHYLKITNFGPIKDEVVLDFEVGEVGESEAYEVEMPDGRRLLKLGYIYGANASGKTTVLKAFDFLRKLLLKPKSDKALELDFDPFLFRDSPYTIPSDFELSFYVQDVRYIYNLKFNKQGVLHEKIVYYQTAKPTELFTRITAPEKRLAKIDFGSRIRVPARERDLLEANTLHNNTVIGAYARTNVDIAELEKLNLWFNQYLLGMISASQDLTHLTTSYFDHNPLIGKWISTFLHKADNQISKVNISDYDINVPYEDPLVDLNPKVISQGSFPMETVVRPDKGTGKGELKYYGGGSIQRKIDFIHKLNNQDYTLPIQSESNGTKRYFGLGGALYEIIHNPHMLCIDELETSLHPDLMKHFLQVFLLNSTNSQLLITTHNVSLLENQDFIRKDALWFSEKNNDGAMNLYSASDFDSSVLRKDASIINAYRVGKLGAKPNLGSPFLTEG
ncbi:AAA family ATPase [Algoriphagus resistens]|uniref:AAA family ATPase n=1 Tax=Algoriphagus resistens TaxID=1750590 RepID=UPI000716AE92|nr:ATP-binding protein [Algoriphagus resistens]